MPSTRTLLSLLAAAAGVAVALKKMFQSAERRQPKNPPRTLGRVFNPYSALDLPTDAPEREVTERYEQLLAKYHPSRVAHLPEALRRLAHDRTIQVQRAYQMLREAREQ